MISIWRVEKCLYYVCSVRGTETFMLELRSMQRMARVENKFLKIVEILPTSYIRATIYKSLANSIANLERYDI